MQQELIFKNIKGKVNIIANDNLNFDKFIKILKTRLERLYIKEDLLKTDVILDIRKISLNTKEILNIFDVLASFENIYVSKIIYNENNKKNIILHEGNIRAGEIKFYSSNVLLIGNVNKGAKIIVNGNLYVIGKVCGTIEFKNINNKLMTSCIDNAFIKICSIEKQFDYVIENVSIRLDNLEIIEEKFMDRRERNYGKSNCSYIW